MSNTKLLKALREIAKEAKKQNPNPDKIFNLAIDALAEHNE